MPVEALRNGLESIHVLAQERDLTGIEHTRKIDIAVAVEGFDLLFECLEGDEW